MLASGCAAQQATVAAPDAAAEEALGADAPVAAALRRACYDCHSTEKRPVWNAKLAFSYWFPNHSLDAVNFSDWKSYDAKRRAETYKAIADVVRASDMPPVDYRILHPSAKLTDAEKNAIVAWATAAK